MANAKARIAAPFLCALFAISSFAQAPAFRQALPGYQFDFPADHGSHDQYKTEWWYFTGHIEGESGRRYGFEVTFFRVGVVPPSLPETRWDMQNVALAHFAVTDVSGKKFRYYEKLNRSAPFTAAAATGRLDVFNEGWRATTTADGGWRLTASAGGDSIDLLLRSAKPPAIHGENGVSQKSPGAGNASHYYSMTRLGVSGTIRVQGRAAERCSGLAWMDHEFGSSILRENQQGWDWFSVQLENETEVMLYVIRRSDGSPDVTSSGSVITATGDVIHIRRDQMTIRPLGRWKSPRSGAVYPMGWQITIPSLNIALRVRPLLENQELITKGSTQVTYWEGAASVDGSFGDVAVRGSAYVEMTGYDKPFRQ